MADDAEVFVYTGVGEVAVVLTDVVLVSIDPSIIPDRALWRQRKLKDIVLLSGLREIGHQATI